MAMGYRDVIGDDRIQFVRAVKPELTPKLADVKDSDGNKRQVILIDTRSQQRACEIILKVMGLIQSGVNVNLNTAPGGAAGPGAQGNFGDRVLHLSSTTATKLGAALAALAPDERREIMAAIRHDQEAAAKVAATETEAG